jgi:AcrR family transcriptional regulator
MDEAADAAGREGGPVRGRRRGRPSLLDVAAEVLVADPAASLAEVAEAAGIGRTTLHKHYATRDDLLLAVGYRAIDLWEHAITTVTDPAPRPDAPARTAAPGDPSPRPDAATRAPAPSDPAPRPDAATRTATLGPTAAAAGLRALLAAMIPIGPQLAFLWRTPTFDHVPDIEERWNAVEARGLAVLKQAQRHGLLAADVPDWWLLQTCYSITYVAAESVRSGKLAPLDAPGLALRTFLRGLGTTPPPAPAPAKAPGSRSR